MFATSTTLMEIKRIKILFLYFFLRSFSTDYIVSFIAYAFTLICFNSHGKLDLRDLIGFTCVFGLILDFDYFKCCKTANSQVVPSHDTTGTLREFRNLVWNWVEPIGGTDNLT